MKSQKDLFVARDVLVPTVWTSDGLIDLRWQLPGGLVSIIVVRKVGIAPSSISDGETVYTLEASVTHLKDQNLRNGLHYFYRIYCQYQDTQEGSIFSRGIVISGIPEIQPVDLLGFHLNIYRTDENCAVEIQCIPPRDTKILVLRSELPPQHPPGTRLAHALLKELGREVPTPSFPMVDTLVHYGIYYYSLWIYKAGWVYLSKIQRCIYLDDVYAVTLSVLSSHLLLQWKWPAHCQEVFLFVGRTGWPELGVDTVPAAAITRGQYSALGGYLLEVQGAQDYYFIVTAKVRQEEGVILVGTDNRLFLPVASLVLIQYNVEKESRQRWRLSLSLSSPALLPPMLLVGRAGSMPLHKEDGEIIKRIDAINALTKREFSLSLQVQAINFPLFLGLFLQDESQYQFFTVLPVNEFGVKLGL